jgi:hypothetical protein
MLASVLTLAMAAATLRAADAVPRPQDAVLVLDNEGTLQGDAIERSEGRYAVRRSSGETAVPASRVLYLARNMEDAYQFVRRRANLRDPDERLRLARWCQARGLRAQGLTEATAALEMRPGHVASQSLVRSLQAAPPPAPVAPQPQTAASPLPETDVNPEAFNRFCRRVQPILMNVCARCHASGRGGAFQLTWVHESGLANRKATLQNLAAVLAQVSADHPAASPLLTRAITVHGDCKLPPLQGRTMAAYHTLEEWVRLVAPDLPAEPAFPVAAVAPALPDPPAAPEEERADPEEPPSNFAAPATVEEAMPPEPPPKPAAPIDEFDPEIFNRQMRPDK